VRSHCRGEYLVPAGIGQLLGYGLPYRLGQQERVQQQDRLPGTQVDRLAHSADSKGGTAGTASTAWLVFAEPLAPA